MASGVSSRAGGDRRRLRRQGRRHGMPWRPGRHAVARGLFRNLLAASAKGHEQVAPSLERPACALIFVAGACWPVPGAFGGRTGSPGRPQSKTSVRYPARQLREGRPLSSEWFHPWRPLRGSNLSRHLSATHRHKRLWRLSTQRLRRMVYGDSLEDSSCCSTASSPRAAPPRGRT